MSSIHTNRAELLDPWARLSRSAAFYAFGTAAVAPFEWGLHRVDERGDRAAAESTLGEMLDAWRIPPEVLGRFILSAERAYQRVRRVVSIDELNAADKPGFMRETMLPGVGNLFSNDPNEVKRPFLLRLDMFRILLGKFGLIEVPDVPPRGRFAREQVLRCLQAVAHGWIYHEVGHLLEEAGWIRLDPAAAEGARSDFYGLKLRLADRNQNWFNGNTIELKRAIDGVGTDIRVERFARWMLRKHMGVYFRYVYTIGFYAFDAERVFDSPLARHRLMLTLLYDVGLEPAARFGDAFGAELHRAFTARRDAFLAERPFHDFDKLRDLMRLYRDRTELVRSR